MKNDAMATILASIVLAAVLQTAVKAEAAAPAFDLASVFQTAAKTETLADPQPGAKVSVYSTQKNIDPAGRLEAVVSGLWVPLSVSLDTHGAFTLENTGGDDVNYDADTVVWEGYLLSKTAGQFTFTANHSGDTSVSLVYRNGARERFQPANQFALQINDQSVAGNGTQSFNVDLNAGYNRIAVMATMWTGSDTPRFTLVYKPSNSTVIPRSITPKSLYHEEEIGDDDW